MRCIAFDRTTGEIVSSAADHAGLANLEKFRPDRDSDHAFTVWRRAPDTGATEVVHRGKIIQTLAVL